MVASRDSLDERASRNRTDVGPWVKGWFLRELLVVRELTAAGGFASAFVIYWAIPLTFSVIDGTSMTSDAATALKQNWLPLHVHIQFIDRLFDGLIAQQKLHGDKVLAYLQDRTHFLFALIVAVGVGISVLLVRKFERTIRELVSQQLVECNQAKVGGLYNHYRLRAYGRSSLLFGSVMACLTFVAFFSFSRSVQVSNWWGYAGYGSAGTVFSLAISFVVFWGSRGLFILGYGSLMIGRLFNFPVAFRPFHADGCNGFSGVGQLIVLLWIDSLLLLAAIIVTMHFGYLEIEKTPIAWCLAVVGITVMPALVAYPLLKTRQGMLKARTAALRRLEPAMERLYADVERRLEGRESGFDTQLPTFENAEHLYTTFCEANVWPFNRNVTAAIFFVNVLQLAVLVKTIVGGGL